MKTVIAKHAQDVIGALSGFDRLVLRGRIRELAYREGMKSYLYRAGVLLKDFGAHALTLTTWLKNALTGAVEKQGRPVVYLPSSSISKEDTARAIRQRDGITEGTIALLTSVEPCKSYEVYRNREAKKLELKPRFAKVPVSLSLPSASGVWIHACVHSDMVSLQYPGVPQRPGMVGAAVGP